VFPDGPKRCARHMTEADDELLDQLSTRALAVGVRRGAYGLRWPYGPNVYVEMRMRMLDWAEAHGLQLDNRPHRCLSALEQRACLSSTCRSTLADAWLDHVTLWRRGGRPVVLVAQPYVIDPEAQFTLGVLSAQPGLRVELRADSWYGAGTWFVGVWRADA